LFHRSFVTGLQKRSWRPASHSQPWLAGMDGCVGCPLPDTILTELPRLHMWLSSSWSLSFNILPIHPHIYAYTTLIYDFYICLQLCVWVTSVSTGKHVLLLTNMPSVYRSTTMPSASVNLDTIRWRFRDPRRRCSVLKVWT